MAEPTQQETLVLVEHRYVCSECNHLSASLEDALLHQQHHLGPSQQHQYELVGLTGDYQALAMPESNQYQCLECGQLLVSPSQLLEHQEMHIKLLGQDLEVLPSTKGGVGTGPSTTTGSIHYECLECKALFSSQEVWLSHRQSHRAEGLVGQGQGQGQALVDLEHSYQKLEEEEEEEEDQRMENGAGTGPTTTTTTTTMVQLLLYECGECLQLFQNPKEFLEHQAAHLASPVTVNGAGNEATTATGEQKLEELPVTALPGATGLPGI
ncbi:ZN574 protein, partial [Galbula dea]|nr:ZN574 protein [Galbula dea]